MSHFTTTPRAFFSSSFRTSGLIAAFSFLICLFAAQSAQAQLTLTVTRTDDRNTTCVSGDCSLREAVNEANAAATNDTINFSIPAGNAGCTAGVCTITLTLGELVINPVATTGTLTITNSTGASNLLISGNNASRVFYINLGANLTINGVTITKGNGAGTINPAVDGYGGGIYNGSTLTLTNSIVSGNTASYVGGGIRNHGIMTLTNSTVSGNTASDDGGGIANAHTSTLINSIVSGNTASSNGGSILNHGGTVTLTNSIVSGNTASSNGGGIYTLSGITTLTNSTISGNTASRGGGGGMENSGGTLTLTNSTVSGNTAGYVGGGIDNSGGTVTLTNSTISGNTATGGGGIDNNGGTVNLTSVTVTGNKSTNTTSTLAGGISNFDTANLNNTIVAGNIAANASAPPDFGGVVAAGSAFNLIGNGLGTSGISNGDANSNQVGSSASPIDPRLGALANNGGATQTHALLFGSPALDKGNSFTLTTDQRGFARPVNLDDAIYPNATGGDGSDIGAFEAQTAPLGTTAVAVSISGRVMKLSGRGIGNVRLTLTDTNGQIRTATTTSFGYYRFDNVSVGETYILSAVGKRYTFSQPLRVLSINGETDAINFIAD